MTMAVIGLAVFLLPRIFPHHKLASHRALKTGTVQKSHGAVSMPAHFPGSRRLEPTVPVVRSPLPFPAPLPPPRELRGGAPKIVFVIDDVGHTGDYVEDLRRLGNRVTYAILPFLKYSAYYDHLSTETGAEVILHMPLESVKDTIPGPGLIRTNMSNDYVLELLDRELDLLPHRAGVNNHMGSKGTADPWLMEIILTRLKQRNLFFLDSMTTAQSMGRQIGTMLQLPILRRDIFLDNDDSLAAIREQVRLLAGIARKRGVAIGIGHYRATTLQVLNEEIPNLEREGFQMVSLRDILRLRKA